MHPLAIFTQGTGAIRPGASEGVLKQVFTVGLEAALAIGTRATVIEAQYHVVPRPKVADLVSYSLDNA